jgi:hypothetical protein
MLALAGAADVISAIFRNTITQVTTPDRLRGRMSQIYILVVTGGPGFTASAVRMRSFSRMRMRR